MQSGKIIIFVNNHKITPMRNFIFIVILALLLTGCSKGSTAEQEVGESYILTRFEYFLSDEDGTSVDIIPVDTLLIQNAGPGTKPYTITYVIDEMNSSLFVADTGFPVFENAESFIIKEVPQKITDGHIFYRYFNDNTFHPEMRQYPSERNGEWTSISGEISPGMQLRRTGYKHILKTQASFRLSYYETTTLETYNMEGKWFGEVYSHTQYVQDREFID